MSDVITAVLTTLTICFLFTILLFVNWNSKQREAHKRAMTDEFHNAYKQGWEDGERWGRQNENLKRIEPIIPED